MHRLVRVPRLILPKRAGFSRGCLVPSVAPFFCLAIKFAAYIRTMYRVRPRSAPASLIRPCRPIVVAQPPSGPGWAHELKHDGYRLQIHVRDGRVRLYTINGADWSKRYPRIVEGATRLQGSAVLDAEVVWLDLDGVANFDALHTRANDDAANALAFDLLMLNGADLRRKPYRERKAALRKLLRPTPYHQRFKSVIIRSATMMRSRANLLCAC
jgi:ATP-dependent DNA ligase